jgi:hypothetical protein
MPHIGHLLTGAAIGAATAGEPRSRVLRNTWIGGAILLAAAPDVAEWLARLAGATFPHNALASIPIVTAASIVLFVGLRLGLRERRLLVFAAISALASHTLLDTLDGGIPLWWPFSRKEIGPDWLGLGIERGAARLIREWLIFAPLAAAGLAVHTCRKQQSPKSRTALLLAVIATLAAATLGGVIPAVFSAVVVSLLIAAGRPHRPALAHLANALPLLPIVVFGIVEWDSKRHVVMANAAWGRQDYALAMQEFESAMRWGAIDTGIDPLYYIGTCKAALGDEQGAFDYFNWAIARWGDEPLLQYGLGKLLISARQPDLRRPQEALRLANAALRSAPTPQFAQWAGQLRETAAQQVAAQRE